MALGSGLVLNPNLKRNDANSGVKFTPSASALVTVALSMFFPEWGKKLWFAREFNTGQGPRTIDGHRQFLI